MDSWMGESVNSGLFYLLLRCGRRPWARLQLSGELLNLCRAGGLLALVRARFVLGG